MVCPRCRGELSWEDAATRCNACAISFPVRDGLPRMSRGFHESDPRMVAEWKAQSSARSLYVDGLAIMNQWEKEVLPHLVAWLGEVRGPVLDVGCGVGHLGDVLVSLERTDIQLVGVDFQGELLAEVRRGYAMLVEGDVQHLPLRDGCIGAAIASNSLHHFPDPEAAMREVARVLAPGGTFVAYDPRHVAPLEALKKLLRKNDSSFTEDHRAFRVEEYRALLGSSGLTVREVTTVDPLGPLIATALDYLKFGHLGVAASAAHYLAEADRLLGGKSWRNRMGLMLVGLAVKPGGD